MPAALPALMVNEARRLKPSIPLIGFQGIPVRDDIELEMQLAPREGSVGQQ